MESSVAVQMQGGCVSAHAAAIVTVHDTPALLSLLYAQSLTRTKSPARKPVSDEAEDVRVRHVRNGKLCWRVLLDVHDACQRRRRRRLALDLGYDAVETAYAPNVRGAVREAKEISSPAGDALVSSALRIRDPRCKDFQCEIRESCHRGDALWEKGRVIRCDAYAGSEKHCGAWDLDVLRLVVVD